jgi:uncharacterized protein (DUF924 family)
MNERANAILNFWFVESKSSDHFKKNDDFDEKIKNNFENDYLKAINNKLEDWQDNPETCLALIILLDQFSRNLHRNSPLAFSYDYKARLIVNEAIDRGDLETIEMNKKFFLILPLIHSEDINDHIFAHNLCNTYLKDHPSFEKIKKQFDYHTIAIKKFGRYPHRNIILKRESTIEENKFLNSENSSW